MDSFISLFFCFVLFFVFLATCAERLQHALKELLSSLDFSITCTA